MNAVTRELIVLVPGSARLARGSQRDRLVKGMVTTIERVKVDRVETSDVPAGVTRLHASSGPVTRAIDIVEAYWNDLVPSPEAAGVRARFVRGSSLVVYWGFSGVWRGFQNRKYLTLGLIGGGLSLLTWYYGTVVMFVQALLSDQTAGPVVSSVLSPVMPVVTAIGTWKVWALATLVMGLLPVNVLVGVMDLTKRYLTNERPAGEGTGLRNEIRRRVKEQIDAALAAGPYDRLTVVGHSFGAVVAADVLADLPVKAPHLRVVTLGSPIELLARRERWLADEVRKCLERPDLAMWVDICAADDWFASGSDLPDGGRTRVVELPLRGSVVDRLSGRTHRGYFDVDEVVNVLVDAPSAH